MYYGIEYKSVGGLFGIKEKNSEELLALYSGHCPLPLSVFSRQGFVTPQTEEGSIGWGAEEVAQPALGSRASKGPGQAIGTCLLPFFPYPKMSLPVLKASLKESGKPSLPCELSEFHVK